MRAALVQMVSAVDIDTNLAVVSELVEKAVRANASIVLLPENFAQMAYCEADKLKAAETFGQGKIQAHIAKLARDYSIWIVAGTIPVRGIERIRAACLVFDDKGDCVARYDKIHLFDVSVSQVENHFESAVIEPGREVVVVDTPIGRMGLSVCYDLRFPELYRALVAKGAQIFTVPSAFTETTGKVHWEVLLKARAIENQCYVLAPNQGGTHQNGRTTFGHSMAVDSWGKLQTCHPQGEGLILTDIDLIAQDKLRHAFPSLMHRVFF